MSKLIIFDCDGTLLDTFSLIQKSTIETFKLLLPDYKYTLEEIDSFFGPLLDDSFKKYASTKAELDNLIATYKKINKALMHSNIRAYDEILELLVALKNLGYILAIVSNKSSEAIIQGLKLTKIEQFFDKIIGAEMVASAKPHPEGINKLIDFYQPEKTIMIGDTIIDIKAGKNAFVYTIGCTWCKTSREEFEKVVADFIVDHPLEIQKIAEEI